VATFLYAEKTHWEMKKDKGGKRGKTEGWKREGTLGILGGLLLKACASEASLIMGREWCHSRSGAALGRGERISF